MVKNFVILPDVNCDLGESLRHEYDIEYINGHIKTPDGKDVPAFLSWDSISSEEFYKKLKASPDEYSTSPPNIDETQSAESAPQRIALARLVTAALTA